MTEFHTTNLSIFDDYEPWDTIVIPVNCNGVMGSGLASECAEQLPIESAEYRTTCSKKLLYLGEPKWAVARTPNQNPNRSWVVFFPVKDYWGSRAEIRWIRAGLERLIIQQFYLKSIQTESEYPLGGYHIAIPPLGAGFGGLNRDSVNKVIRETLTSSNFPHVTLFDK